MKSNLLPRAIRHILRGLIIVPLALIALSIIVLLATHPQTPPPIDAVEIANEPFAAFSQEHAEPLYFEARDGTQLSYRYYEGQPGKGVAVLIHGSSGSALAMHGIAKALNAEGITVYAPDLRGHGQSPGPGGRLGDVSYRGQYEDDLADLSTLIAKAHPGEKRLLVGHSMGGAIILRTASQPDYAGNFDAYLALAPFIAPDAALNKPDQGGWTVVSIPRIVVLSIYNSLGISALDHMPVLAMAVPESDHDWRPHTYSHALLASANLPRDWEPVIARIEKPTRILIGSDDELFRAEAYPEVVSRANPGIRVDMMPNTGHMTIVFASEAIAVITTTAQDMLNN